MKASGLELRPLSADHRQLGTRREVNSREVPRKCVPFSRQQEPLGVGFSLLPLIAAHQSLSRSRGPSTSTKSHRESLRSADYHVSLSRNEGRRSHWKLHPLRESGARCHRRRRIGTTEEPTRCCKTERRSDSRHAMDLQDRHCLQTSTPHQT